MNALPFYLLTLVLDSSRHVARQLVSFLLPNGIEFLARSVAAQQIWQLGYRPEIRALVNRRARGKEVHAVLDVRNGLRDS